jgi:hypothetical protein
LPFVAPRILYVAHDSGGGFEQVFSTIQTMLEDRAFAVDLHRVGQDASPANLDAYAGVVIGTTVQGMGFGVELSPDLKKCVEGLGDLEEVRVALFSVYRLRPGGVLEELESLVDGLGAEVVARQALGGKNMDKGMHFIPTECMVRIR